MEHGPVLQWFDLTSSRPQAGLKSNVIARTTAPAVPTNTSKIWHHET